MTRPLPPFKSAIALAVGLLLLASGAHADMEAGRRAFLGGEYATALREFKAAGEAGNVQALFLAGQMLVMGQGVDKDMPGGLALLERAAAAGHIQAGLTAGTAYAYADGVPADYTRAFRLLEPAAQAGDPHAQNNIAVLYHFGLGTAVDQVKAMSWVVRAERQGLLQAINLRQEIEATLTLAQKAEAMKLAGVPLQAAAGSVRPAPNLAEVSGAVPQSALPPQAAPQPSPLQPVAPRREPEPPPPLPAASAALQGSAVSVAPPAAPPPAGAVPGGAVAGGAVAGGAVAGGAVADVGWAVQLAALADRDEAEKQWRAISQRQSALLGGLEPTFAAADLGAKGVFIRVLVGNHATRADAEAFCARLKQAGQDCLTRRR